MGASNMSYRSYSTPISSQKGYMGTLPTLVAPQQASQSSSQKQPEFQLNFGIQNSATKALKQADKSIDFIKV